MLASLRRLRLVVALNPTLLLKTQITTTLLKVARCGRESTDLGVAASGLRDAPSLFRPGRRAVFGHGWHEAGSSATSREPPRAASSRPARHECALRELP